MPSGQVNCEAREYPLGDVEASQRLLQSAYAAVEVTDMYEKG